MKLRSLLIGLAIAVTVPAWSVTQDLGEIDTSDSSFSRAFVRFFGYGTPVGAFTDYYTFTLGGGGAGATGGIASFELGWVDLALSSVALYTGSSLIASDSTPGTFSFSNLSGGTQYTLAVSGNLASSPNLDLGAAFYQGTIRSVASAASEPSALALALAGLIGVGLLARRRRA